MARILIVDENDEVRLFHRVLLEEWEGYEIVDVGTGAAAIEALAHEDVDAVVLDLRLPDIDGVQLLKAIRSLQPDLPVIINTGYNQLRDYFNSLGVKAFVPKTNGFPELESALAGVISAKTQRPNYASFLIPAES